MKSLIVALCLVISGCATTVPVKQEFFNLPDELRKPCEPLLTIDTETTTLHEMMKVVVKNYMRRHECAMRLDAIIEWHDEQKKVFEKVYSK